MSGLHLPRPQPPPPEFFVDRSLGNIVIATALRGIGHTVRTMRDVYPGREETVEDTEWIRDADSAGWVALTKDERITRYPTEQAALVASALRVFAIGNQHLQGPVMARYDVDNINRIIQRSRKPGPFVDVVYPTAVERRWPRAQASGT